MCINNDILMYTLCGLAIIIALLVILLIAYIAKLHHDSRNRYIDMLTRNPQKNKEINKYDDISYKLGLKSNKLFEIIKLIITNIHKK